MDYEKATLLLTQWQTLCENDNATLWGVNLHTPFVFVDRETRQAVANMPDIEGIFTQQGDFYVGTFPIDLPIAATAMEFGGMRWAMAPWDLFQSDNHVFKLDTMVHEAFHCIQPHLLGEMAHGNDTSHIDALEIRVLFLLEMTALIKALETEGLQRQNHIQNALAFRHKRRENCPNANDENQSEMNEGTAVYTALKLTCDHEGHINEMRKYIEWTKARDSIAHFFGYVSGAMYGLVLDAVNAQWRKGLTFASDLGELLRNVLAITTLPPYEKNRHGALQPQRNPRPRARKNRKAQCLCARNERHIHKTTHLANCQ